MLEVARDTVTLGVGKRCAFGDIDGKLDFAVRRVDALAAWSRRFRETLREIGGGDDRTVGDPRAGRYGHVVHAAQPRCPQPFLVSAEAETASRRPGSSLSIILVTG